MTELSSPPVEDLAGSTSRRNKRAIAFVKWLAFAVLIFFVGRSLWRQLATLDWRAVHFRMAPLLLATAALTIVYAARSASFRILLDGYGIKITWRQAAIVGWVPQIGKYIPGQVASIAGAVAILRSFAVPAPIALAITIVMDGLAVLTGLIAGSPLLLWQPIRQKLPHGWLWCGVIVVAGIICLHPRVYARLLNFALKKLHRPPLTKLPPWHNYISPVLLGFAQWALAGVALWSIARSVTTIAAAQIPLCMAIAGVGYTAGYVAPAPSGLGVRDPIFQFALTPIVGAPAAVIVIAMRLVQTIVEILMALAGWALLNAMRSRGRNTPLPFHPPRIRGDL